MIPKVLTIAGSDPSGGAGIQADLKTFSALGCYGMSVITALTAQNTQGVSGVHEVPADFVALQLKTIFDDIAVGAVKTGMAGNPETIRAMAEILQHHAVPLVVDPVMVSQSGHRLISDEAIAALKKYLIPQAAVITPNLPEAEVLLGYEIDDPPTAAKALLETGAQAVLLKGGHRKGETALDILVTADGDLEVFEAPRLKTKNTHGTGCTLSAALCCFLAKGLALPDAAGEAKSYLTAALAHADELQIGTGAGPVHHFYKLWRA